MSCVYEVSDGLKWKEMIEELPKLKLSIAKVRGIDVCITDGEDYVWAYQSVETGGVFSFERFGLNDPTSILSKIADRFDVYIISEHGEVL